MPRKWKPSATRYAKYLKSTLPKNQKQEIETVLHLGKIHQSFVPVIGIWRNALRHLFRRCHGKDSYKKFNETLLYHQFMPNNSIQKINHGLNGHYTGWAHALAMLVSHFNDVEMRSAACGQLYFELGFNPAGVSFVSGIGYNNPMPHSRFLGMQIGGFLSGFIGNTDDPPHVDLMAKAQWNSTEYWNTPIANACMALAELLPKTIEKKGKSGKYRG